jgi:hypothetical protein
LKKRKPPQLVVDNKFPDPDDDTGLSKEEVRLIMEQVTDVHNRYPEIDALIRRARETDDRAMWCACVEMVVHYSMWRDLIAEKQREKLRVVKKKRDP